MTVYAITDTKKGRTGIMPTYLQTTRGMYSGVYYCLVIIYDCEQIKMRKWYHSKALVMGTVSYSIE